jgi:2-dehydro-3-deoxygluconokinase
MYDIVAFGEGLVRLSPGRFQRLEQASVLDLHIGGAELNVAVGASRLGLRSTWVSKLPDNPFGRMIRNKAREHGVGTDHILWSDTGRTGLYFLELGATPRNTSVVYDRAGSAFCSIKPGELDWETILGQTRCLHVTGITPAVSASAAEATVEALQTARRQGCKVSLDLNYRAKLWDPETAARTLSAMMPYVDILITTAGDTRTVLGITAADDESLATELTDRYPCDVVAVTHREGASVWKCRWSGLVRAKGKTVTSSVYDIDIVDQVGRGDAFAAGFLAGYLPEEDITRGLDFGIAFSALKHSMPGDVNWCDRRDVEALLAGPAPGVSR